MTSTTTSPVLYNTHVRVPGGPYTLKIVRSGDRLPLSAAMYGSLVRLDTGEEGHVVLKSSSNVFVRITLTQDVVKIPKAVEVTVLDYSGYNDGSPNIGEFVVPRDGKFAGQIGVVAHAAVNSTKVGFPGVQGLQTFKARDLKIVKAQIIPVQ